MNKRYTEFQLKEALEQLQQTLSSINGDDFDDINLQLDMEHLYHHLNTAWNARNATDKDTDECSQANFEKWRQFPTDIDLSC